MWIAERTALTEARPEECIFRCSTLTVTSGEQPVAHAVNNCVVNVIERYQE
jgi:hypothetical protein